MVEKLIHQISIKIKKAYKEPLAKQAALVYNLIRKVYRTRSSDCPQLN